jgi:RNA polymerase sigma-70 factor, ECF subfamily
VLPMPMLTSDMPDRDLLKAAATGDAEAFREAVQRFSSRIVCFLDRFISDRARAADLTQETFLRLYQRLRDSPSEHPGDPMSLIFTIAANLGRDELRRRNVRKESPLANAIEPSVETPPEARIERDERHHVVRTALAALDSDDRLLLLLREVHGMPYDGIATVLGVRLGTIKSRISRARVAFRDSWLRCGGKRVE